MTQKNRDIGDPLEQAATFGTIGGKKAEAQESSSQDAQDIKHSDVQTSKTGRRKQTVYLSPYLVKWIKHQAAEQDKEISEIVEEAIEEYRAARQ